MEKIKYYSSGIIIPGEAFIMVVWMSLNTNINPN